MQCCKDQGVKSSCLGICSLNLDLDLLLYDTECIPEFDRLMECGSGIDIYYNLGLISVETFAFQMDQTIDIVVVSMGFQESVWIGVVASHQRATLRPVL